MDAVISNIEPDLNGGIRIVAEYDNSSSSHRSLVAPSCVFVTMAFPPGHPFSGSLEVGDCFSFGGFFRKVK